MRNFEEYVNSVLKYGTAQAHENLQPTNPLPVLHGFIKMLFNPKNYLDKL